ncbi:metabolite traffic protein EboE [Daejeonella sp.]|uniref:metabolite traffic protein EboE n=1 Tax=Daejeonella sp. TaxID=2805397 RepID=UPI003982FA4F
MKIAAGHFTYCTNIHAGESWTDHFESLKEKFPLIKAEVSRDQPMGIGLRLSNKASKDLQDYVKLEEFQLWMKENDAYVFTMNGFPYGDFHHAIVKDQVHTPDWTTAERLEYTLRLFEILAELLPDGIDGGVSTSPLSYRHWYSSDVDSRKAMHLATGNMISILEHLFLYKKNRGLVMHLDIEPEPDGLLETGREFIDWYQGMLVPMALKELSTKHNLSNEDALEAIREHIRLCYDVCHFAIGYEPHHEILAELSNCGIKVGKIQISAALKSDLPPEPESRTLISEAFFSFVEPTYLHQVVARKTDGELIRYCDLPDALTDIQNPEVEEWRAHFHVPVFLKDLGFLESTQSDITEVLNIQCATPFTNHLEVETYTWEVLPDILKMPIELSISRELNWVKEVFRKNE